ncbi:minor tail protein [Arthrobacter phage Atraxa]|uniref:Minor tail protein n=1 Tax=Arthrobacter phage Atraxa TaxID=2419947 RepID=A0A3G2KDB2_9CAUD|nr:tail protein [Arthrobacter phage Atraxa]AYN56967.1 minor tail protein [Arthrobacter phage Atraxa]AYN59075.1 minor tail protein [Arthrobacter phage Sputnik]
MESSMTTAAQYGMSTPVGTDLIRDGDDAITKNANATAVVLTRLEEGKFKPQPIPEGADLNTIADGFYFSRSASLTATISNRPVGLGDAPFDFESRTSKEGGFSYKVQGFSGYSGSGSGYFKRNTSNSTGSAFIPWRRLDNETAPPVGTAGAANPLRQQKMRDYYGPIGTGGLGVVSMRFDHGLANFNSKMRPALEARSMEYALVLSARNFNAGENAGVSGATVAGWALAEVWNHGANQHQDESSIAGLTDQIATGKKELELAVPGKPIWGYAVPGTGGTGQGGFGSGATAEAFYETAAGDLILTHHAVSTGAWAGTARRPMDGNIRQGMAHFTMEAQTVARIKTEIDSAISGKQGLTLMMHPSLIDTAGYLTTAQFVEVLDYLVAKRTAKQVLVLSPYKMALANKSLPVQ